MQNLPCNADTKTEKSSSSVQLVLEISIPGLSGRRCTTPFSEYVKMVPVPSFDINSLYFKHKHDNSSCFSSSDIGLNISGGLS